VDAEFLLVRHLGLFGVVCSNYNDRGDKTFYVVSLITLPIMEDGVMSEMFFFCVKCHVFSASSHVVLFRKQLRSTTTT
jgi:hypothetical protein